MGNATKILIVEDEVVVAMELRSKLTAMGYEIVGIADTGEAATEKAQSLLPDAVLMDIKLAGPMDGIDAAETIRRRHKIPVVFLTAHSDHRTLQRAKLSEPFGYLVKPFSGTELRTTLEVAVHKHRQDRKAEDRAQWFARVHEVVGGAVIAADGKGKVQSMNAVAETLTGRSRDEAVGKPIDEVLVLKDPMTGRRVAPIPPGMGTEGLCGDSREYLLVPPTGSEIPIAGTTFIPGDPGMGEESIIFTFQETSGTGRESGNWFELAANLRMTAAMCRLERKHELASRFYGRAWAILEQNLGPDNPKVLGLLNDIAELYNSIGRTCEAQFLRLRAQRTGAAKQHAHLRDNVLPVSRIIRYQSRREER